MMDILDITAFTNGGLITEAGFFDLVEKFDWEQFRDKRVLVKGCGTTVVPPWAFMVVASRLTQVAKRIRYGNEHSSVPVFSNINRETADADQ